MKTPHVLVLAAAMTVAACSGAPKIDGKLGPGVSMSGRSSFAILAAPKGVGERTEAGIAFVEDRAAPEVAKAMAAKGYVAAPKDSADLHVAVFISQTGEVDAVRWGYSSVGWMIWGPWWGAGAYGYTADYKQGTLVVDVVDAKGKTPLYRGVASVTLGLSGTRGDLDQETLRGYVKGMLKDLPPRS